MSSKAAKSPPSSPRDSGRGSISPSTPDGPTTPAADASVVTFSRLTSDLSAQAASKSGDSAMWSSVRSPHLQRAEGIEQDFDAALKMMIKTPIDPAAVPAVTMMMGKKEVVVQDIKVIGLSSLRRHGDVMCADEDEDKIRRTAAHLFVGPVRMTFKVSCGSWKRRMEVTADGIRFGVRIKGDRNKKEMKLEKLGMETFAMRIKLRGEKRWDPVANFMLLALNPLIKMKVRQLLETQLATEVTKYQDKTSLKMIRMLYGIKEKPWSGLEGRIFGKSRK